MSATGVHARSPTGSSRRARSGSARSKAARRAAGTGTEPLPDQAAASPHPPLGEDGTGGAGGTDRGVSSRVVWVESGWGSGVLDASANVFYVLALDHGLLSVVSVLTALYPAGTVLLARYVLSEHLSSVQRAGLGVAAVAAVLIAV